MNTQRDGHCSKYCETQYWNLHPNIKSGDPKIGEQCIKAQKEIKNRNASVKCTQEAWREYRESIKTINISQDELIHVMQALQKSKNPQEGGKSNMSKSKILEIEECKRDIKMLNSEMTKKTKQISSLQNRKEKLLQKLQKFNKQT